MTVIEILPLLKKLNHLEKIQAMQFLLSELAQEEKLPSKGEVKIVEQLGWPRNFFTQTYGSLRDVGLLREPQGEYEVREELP